MRRVKSPVDRWRLLVSGPVGRYKGALPLNNRATLDERLKVLSHRPLPSSRDWCALLRVARKIRNIASCWKALRSSCEKEWLRASLCSCDSFENGLQNVFCKNITMLSSLSERLVVLPGTFFCVFESNKDVWVAPFKCPTLCTALLINIRTPCFPWAICSNKYFF